MCFLSVIVTLKCGSVRVILRKQFYPVVNLLFRDEQSVSVGELTATARLGEPFVCEIGSISVGFLCIYLCLPTCVL